VIIICARPGSSRLLMVGMSSTQGIYRARIPSYLTPNHNSVFSCLQSNPKCPAYRRLPVQPSARSRYIGYLLRVHSMPTVVCQAGPRTANWQGNAAFQYIPYHIFHLGVAVLGLELRLPCYKSFMYFSSTHTTNISCRPTNFIGTSVLVQPIYTNLLLGVSACVTLQIQPAYQKNPVCKVSYCLSSVDKIAKFCFVFLVRIK
jgi:hypothetical protein